MEDYAKVEEFKQWMYCTVYIIIINEVETLTYKYSVLYDQLRVHTDILTNTWCASAVVWCNDTQLKHAEAKYIGLVWCKMMVKFQGFQSWLLFCVLVFVWIVEYYYFAGSCWTKWSSRSLKKLKKFDRSSFFGLWGPRRDYFVLDCELIMFLL